MSRLEIDLYLSTPAFVRGAYQDKPALRETAFKGQLRWWYRAWNPLACQLGQNWAEGRIMGGTRKSEGQCPFTLRLGDVSNVKTISWSEIARNADRGDRQHPGGLRYLGFSLGMKKDGISPNHHAVAPELQFKAVHIFRKEPSTEQVQGLLAAWWLLAHLGGVGARSRRGFGSLVIEGWRWPGQEERLGELPLPGLAPDGAHWVRDMVSGLEVLERWAPARSGWPVTAPNLGPGSEVVLQKSWPRAVDAHEQAGRDLSAGRRAHRGAAGAIDDRVTFGLPLETGKSRRRSWRPGAFRTEPIQTDRHASPLHLHVGTWRGGAGLSWALLAGPRPGLEHYRVREMRAGKILREQAGEAVDAFVGSIRGARWKASRGRATWLHLDAQGHLPLPGDRSVAIREVRYRDLGGPPVEIPVNTQTVDWTAVRDAVSRMAEQAHDDASYDHRIGILVSGLAPLPAFAYLGFKLQSRIGARQVIFNRRQDRRWDEIDLSRPGSELFDEVRGLDGSDEPGLVAVFVSVMGASPKEPALRAYCRLVGRPCAGTVTIRTSKRTNLDARNAPGAANQIADILSQVAGAYPKQQGIALFVAGPASLAFIAGRAVNPNMFGELHLPNYAGGNYLPAIRYTGAYRWRWAFFLAHASPDKAVAERLFELLDRPGRPVFLDTRSIRPGDDWSQTVRQAQRDSRVVVVLLSKHTDDAHYQRAEIADAIKYARENGQRIVPVYLPERDRDDPPYGLSTVNGITVDDTNDLQPLADRLNALLDDLGADV